MQCLCAPTIWSRELKLTIEPSFTSGNTGTDSTTDTFEVPLRLHYQDGPSKAGFRIPYLSVTGPQSPVPGVGLVGSETATPHFQPATAASVSVPVPTTRSSSASHAAIASCSDGNALIWP